ncbi:hypothetical protein ABZ619_38710 [Streptomyces sp. NPDC007851]|uniref:hypothetical protein n=1 Tax=Streptomyces sp. NPDC007851 TaxID=3155008 RepID=UPI0033C2DB3E
MNVTTPTAERVQALHRFIQDRNEEAWQRALSADDLSADHLDAFRRVNNSNKLALAGTTAYLLHELSRWGEASPQALRLWDHLTQCGEEWQDHPGWKPEWANPARAALR